MGFSTGKRIKSYVVFTSIPYRVAVWALMPAGLVGLAAWLGGRIGDLGLPVALMPLVMAEVLSDSWLFGGIQAKDSEKIDYLKSSGRGMGVMGNALAADLARKLLTALAVVSASYFFIGKAKGGLEGMPGSVVDFISAGETAQEIGFLGYLVLLSYSGSAFGTFLSRYGSSIPGNMMVGCVAMILAGMAGMYVPTLIGYPSDSIFLLGLPAAAAGAGVSVLAARAAMKKVKGGYYDD